MSRPRSPETLTPWYPGDVRPVRRGVYERRMQIYQGRFSFWNGSCWCGWASTAKDAKHNGLFIKLRSSVQNAQWRGLLRVMPEKK